MKKKTKLYLVCVGLLLCLGIITTISISHKVAGKYAERIYEAVSVPERMVGLILGAQVWDDKTPSHILEDRLLTGVELYKNNKVRRLILSGDHGTKTYDEVNAMKKFILNYGVKEEDIFMDHAGFRTYDSCYRARDVFGVKSMIIITNEFHLPRALYIANELGIDAVGVKSDLRRYQTENYNYIREFGARVKAYLDVAIITPPPKFLGPVIDINGNGLVTQD